MTVLLLLACGRFGTPYYSFSLAISYVAAYGLLYKYIRSRTTIYGTTSLTIQNRSTVHCPLSTVHCPLPAACSLLSMFWSHTSKSSTNNEVHYGSDTSLLTLTHGSKLSISAFLQTYCPTADPAYRPSILLPRYTIPV